MVERIIIEVAASAFMADDLSNSGEGRDPPDPPSSSRVFDRIDSGRTIDLNKIARDMYQVEDLRRW